MEHTLHLEELTLDQNIHFYISIYIREELGNNVPLLTINLSPKQLMGEDLV